MMSSASAIRIAIDKPGTDFPSFTSESTLSFTLARVASSFCVQPRSLRSRSKLCRILFLIRSSVSIFMAPIVRRAVLTARLNRLGWRLRNLSRLRYVEQIGA